LDAASIRLASRSRSPRGEANALSERARSASESKGDPRSPSCSTPTDDAIVVRVPFVYILRCADDSFYVGSTHDPESRESVHNCGRGALFTRRRRPVTLVCTEAFASMPGAVARERQLKRWTRAKKQALISGDLVQLKRA